MRYHVSLREESPAPGQPGSAPRPGWPNSPESWSLSMGPWHAHQRSHGIGLLAPGPAAAAHCCWSIPLSLGVVKHLRSNCPHILGPAKAACLCPASFAVYSKRNWIHMDQIPPHSSHTGQRLAQKGRALWKGFSTFPGGQSIATNAKGMTSPWPKAQAGPSKPNPRGSEPDKAQGQEEPAISVPRAGGKAGNRLSHQLPASGRHGVQNSGLRSGTSLAPHPHPAIL